MPCITLALILARAGAVEQTDKLAASIAQEAPLDTLVQNYELPTIRAALELDATLIPHALISVGYLAQEPKRRPHRPVSELVVRFD